MRWDSTVELFDAHSHLEMPQLFSSANRIIKRARQAGVIGIVVSAIEPKYYSKAIDLKNRFPNYIWVTFGLHPPRATPKMVTQCLRLIREHADQIIAIGEVGLDYYWVKEQKERQYQRQAFVEFIRLAAELNLPVVVHSRDAEVDAMSVLQEEHSQSVQLHCFNDPTQVIKAVNHHWFMSVPTSVVTRRRMQEVVSRMPLGNMLLETDAPYLSPIPGQQNEPANLVQAAHKIAELKAVNAEEVAFRTTENALQLFGLEQGDRELRQL